MKRIMLVAVLAAFSLTSLFAQKYENLALTPPMGWNSWNKFACNIDENIIKGVADAMVESGLRDAGYVYLNLDDCWHGERDSLGFIQADPVKFPSGIKALADYVHSKGLKIGIYSDAGRKTCGGRPGSFGHEYQDAYSFAQLCDMAEESRDFSSRVDVNDQSFLSPDSMIEAIKQYCQKTGQPVPETVGELAAVVYRSLAQSYGETVKELETIAGRTYDSIHIIGGGSNAAYLNQLTAEATGKIVYAGPGEATAIGNLLAQMIHAGDLADLKGARQCVRDSFEIKTYVPEN